MGFQRKENPFNAILPTVRVHRSELDTVKNAAVLAGSSVADYIRSKVLADSALIISQSSDIPSQEPLAVNSPDSSLSAQPATSEDTETAGRESVLSHEAIPAKKKNECEHGFKRIGRLTACAECKKGKTQ